VLIYYLTHYSLKRFQVRWQIIGALTAYSGMGRAIIGEIPSEFQITDWNPSAIPPEAYTLIVEYAACWPCWVVTPY
jgi:hypothetical protein